MSGTSVHKGAQAKCVQPWSQTDQVPFRALLLTSCVIWRPMFSLLQASVFQTARCMLLEEKMTTNLIFQTLIDFCYLLLLL